MARAEADVASIGTVVAGELRIGSFSAATRSVIPHALTRLAQHPDLDVRFAAGDAEDLLVAVTRRALDLVVIDSWVTMPLQLPPDVAHTALHEDFADVAFPATHRPAGSESVDLEDLGDVAWVTSRQGESFHTWLVQTLRARGVEPSIRYEVPEFAAQLEFVAQGLGAALIPRLAHL